MFVVKVLGSPILLNLRGKYHDLSIKKLFYSYKTFFNFQVQIIKRSGLVQERPNKPYKYLLNLHFISFIIINFMEFFLLFILYNKTF